MKKGDKVYSFFGKEIGRYPLDMILIEGEIVDYNETSGECKIAFEFEGNQIICREETDENGVTREFIEDKRFVVEGYFMQMKDANGKEMNFVLAEEIENINCMWSINKKEIMERLKFEIKNRQIRLEELLMSIQMKEEMLVSVE